MQNIREHSHTRLKTCFTRKTVSPDHECCLRPQKQYNGKKKRVDDSHSFSKTTVSHFRIRVARDDSAIIVLLSGTLGNLSFSAAYA